MNQVMEEYTFIYLNLNAILKTIYRDLIKIINADLWLRYVWKKNTEALLMLVEMWSMGILDREAPIDLFPYRKSKMFGNKIQHFEQDMICFKSIRPVLFFLMCFRNSYRIFSCCYIIYNYLSSISFIPWYIYHTSILNW